MKGFTLIETLVSIFIFVLIIGLVFGSIVMIYRTQSFAWQQSSAVEEARIGIKTMVREIRQAKTGDDGSYAIEKADDKEFIFYGDVDHDGAAEKVRYFLGAVGSGAEEKNCVAFSDGGNCALLFSNFFEGTLISAQIKVSIEGDFGWDNIEYAQIYADGSYLNRICSTGCADCPGFWQGNMVFNVTSQAADNQLEILVDANSQVDNICSWQEPNHAMKVRVELSWQEENPNLAHQLKKGVINPLFDPVSYPLDQEEVSIISSYVRNAPPIFEYYNAQGQKITETPARLSDTKVMKIYLVINVDPERPPQDVEMESYVQLRNLKQ